MLHETDTSQSATAELQRCGQLCEPLLSLQKALDDMSWIYVTVVIATALGLVLSGYQLTPWPLLRALLGLGTAGESQKIISRGSVGRSDPRSVAQRMRELNKNCVVFFGSQTGNSQDLAGKLVKEGHARFGLETMLADLDDFDYHTLVDFPQHGVAIFLLSSYGEGEPTDNAAGFYDFITGPNPEFLSAEGLGEAAVAAGDAPLNNLRYVAFGVGNSTYEHYNAVIRNVDAALERHGAQRLAEVGQGDDALGTVEDSFLSWKETMWTCLRGPMSLEEHRVAFQPSFVVTTQDHAQSGQSSAENEHDDSKVEAQTRQRDNHNRASVPLVSSRELFDSADRNCTHMELDILGSGLSYQTGDHVAVWPENDNDEVERFLRVFGLWERRDAVIITCAIEESIPVPIPRRTTYAAAVRSHLEIAGPVSRQALAIIAQFTDDDGIRLQLSRLSSDAGHFRERVTLQLWNLAQVMESISTEEQRRRSLNIPFAVLIECVKPLQPRYYSISSSSLVQPGMVSITAVADSVEFPGRRFRGVASNFLLGTKRLQNGEQAAPKTTTQKANMNTSEHDDYRLLVNIRHSTFRLPQDVSRPVIMIGPGTGIAPFRAFVQERIAQAQAGAIIGKLVLFYGCRTQKEDFIYHEEWEAAEKTLGDKFTMLTAFSRQGLSKVYVQHLLADRADDVLPLLQREQASLYICGDSRMSRDVQQTLRDLLRSNSTGSLADAEDFMRKLRSEGRLQEDVW